jgi:hypothetical protein
MLVANHHLAEIIPFDESEQEDIELSFAYTEPEDLLKQHEETNKNNILSHTISQDKEQDQQVVESLPDQEGDKQ